MDMSGHAGIKVNLTPNLASEYLKSKASEAPRNNCGTNIGANNETRNVCEPS